MGTRLMVGTAYTQGRHVVLEVVLVYRSKLVIGRSRPARCFREHVINVGDVACDDRCEIGMTQGADQRIHPYKGCGVADVRHVVRSDATHVDAGRADHRQGLPRQSERRRR